MKSSQSPASFLNKLFFIVFFLLKSIYSQIIIYFFLKESSKPSLRSLIYRVCEWIEFAGWPFQVARRSGINDDSSRFRWRRCWRRRRRRRRRRSLPTRADQSHSPIKIQTGIFQNIEEKKCLRKKKRVEILFITFFPSLPYSLRGKFVYLAEKRRGKKIHKLWSS